MVNIEHISYTYPRCPHPVLEDVCFSLEPGQCMAVLGNNGAGKSTLLKCIDRICPTKNARVEIDGQDVLSMKGRMLARNIAYVPQRVGASQMTVYDTVLLGRKPYIQWDATREDRDIVEGILDRMELSDYAIRNVSELSGGEAQKVMMARALAQQPRLLLLDEPTSSLDPRNQHEVLRLVREIAKTQALSVLLIIHDLNLALRYCDRFLFLKDSKVHSVGGLETVTPDTIREVYGMEVQMLQYGNIPMIVPFPEDTGSVVTEVQTGIQFYGRQTNSVRIK